MTVEEIFLVAVEKPADERAAYLDAACAGNTELRAQVDALVRSHERAGGPLEKPLFRTAPTIDHAPPAAESGTFVGPYKLAEQIGEGGMGSVWMAQQTEPVKRLVALKLIKPGMDSKQVIARFEAERQALALMDHPNIAKVLDGGTTSTGRPYFVMDLVKGVPITKYCDEHHLTPRQRLELFLPVCQAVQHAHQRGIIHRDLKPSNVLVAQYDGRPVPMVIDFGVAKATGQTLTDKTLVTGFGAIVGSPEYMSPEQAEFNQLDIDTRSDVYSLGVLLYELLAGSPPFGRPELKQGGVLEVLRLIREQEPTKPSAMLSTAEGLPTLAANRSTEPAKLTKLVRGELDWIVMKALEKDRNRRYETTYGLSMDVQRYLAGEVVQACPPSAVYQFKKFVRRNKGPVAVAGMLGVAVLIAVGAVAGSLGWAARVKAERLAKAANHVALIADEVQRLEAEQKWPEALAAAKRAESVIASGEVDDATRKSVADMLKTLAFLDRLERARMTAATWVDKSFDYAGAERQYVDAFREYRLDIDDLPVETSIARLKARPSIAIPLAAALDHWAHVRWKLQGDSTSRKRLASVARGIDSDPLRNRLRSIVDRPVAEVGEDLLRMATSISAGSERPATIVVFCDQLARVGQSDHAVRLLQDAQRVHPGDFWLNFYLAYLLQLRGDTEGAARFYTVAVSLRPRSIAALNNLGLVLFRKKPEEASFFFHKAIELDPKQTRLYAHLGSLLRDQNKLEAAVSAHRKAIELSPKDAHLFHELGATLWVQKKPDEAIEAYRKAIELDPKDVGAHNSLAGALGHLDRMQEALSVYRKVIELDPRDAMAHLNIAELLVTADDANFNTFVEAATSARKAIEIDPGDTRFPKILGEACYRSNDWRAAIAALEKSMKLNQGGESLEWFILAMAHCQLGEQAKARDYYDRGVMWMDKYKPKSKRLGRLRQEAEALLESKEKMK